MKLEEVERLAQQLATEDQRRLADGIYRQLEAEPLESEAQRQARRERMLAALALSDKIAESINGEFDSAKDLRRIREQRIADVAG